MATKRQDPAVTRENRRAGAAKARARRMALREIPEEILKRRNQELEEYNYIMSPELIEDIDLKKISERMVKDFLDTETASSLEKISPKALRALLNGEYDLSLKANNVIEQAEAQQHQAIIEAARKGQDKASPILLKKIDEREKAREQLRYELALLIDTLREHLSDEDYRRVLFALSSVSSANVIRDYDKKLSDMGVI